MQVRTATKQQKQAIDLYTAILEEVKVRISSIAGATTGSTGLPAKLALEYCYLQLRMLCELIALGCLTAHGDITGAQSKLQKEWSAGKIVTGLQTLHPNFYPHPIWVAVIGNTAHLDSVASGFLTKEELVTLYGNCGDRLHRGTLKKLLGHQPGPAVSFDEVTMWTQKIIALLTQHRIASFDNHSHFICTLKQAEAGDRAQVGLALSPLPPP